MAKPWLQNILVHNDRSFARRILRCVHGTASATVIHTGNKATTVVLANDHAARCWDLLEERRKRQSGSGMLQNVVSMSVLVGIPSAFAIPWLGTPGFTSLLGMSASVFAGVCVAAVIVEHPRVAKDK